MNNVADPVSLTLRFHCADETPVMPEGDSFPQAVLYNPCDGYHIVFARFDSQDGEFLGFTNFIGTESWGKDCYAAWALLPDCNEALRPSFWRPNP